MRDDATHDIEGQERRRTRARRAGPLPAALASAALLAAACSGGSAHNGAGTGSPGGSARTSALAYSQCMRAHGISHFPDPNAQGGIGLKAGPGTGIDPNSPQFKAADQACKALMPASHLSPAQQAKVKAQALKYSQCMRAHGIADFPDPNSQGGIAIRAKQGSDLNPNDPRFQAANTACQRNLPGGGHGGSLSTNGSAGGAP